MRGTVLGDEQVSPVGRRTACLVSGPGLSWAYYIFFADTIYPKRLTVEMSR